jgi:hypothetical protein
MKEHEQRLRAMEFELEFRRQDIEEQYLVDLEQLKKSLEVQGRIGSVLMGRTTSGTYSNSFELRSRHTRTS